MSSCIQEAFLLKDLSSSLSLYLSFCVSLSSSWSPPDEPWCSPRSDDVWYVSGSAQIAEMWLFIDDRLTGWRRRRRRQKATVRSAPDGSDNKDFSQMNFHPKIVLIYALLSLQRRHPHLQQNYTGHETTPCWNIFCWSFLGKTKRVWPFPGHVHGEFFLCALQLALCNFDPKNGNFWGKNRALVWLDLHS